MSVTRETGAFVIHDDGATAGRTEFLDRGSERIFYHTEIGEEFGGRGLASQLIDAALDATAADGLDVVAVCPFVRGRLEKHPEVFGGSWRRPSTSDLEWLKEQK
ncbi:GNAT family N-acetyltransferase [Corynebacterium doosanense]|uniref:Acetyltransferase n=1 Tax=Corynebacterium doosanense CAU 212 = DSM 45436 TaxID=558173 RepID=A0A097IHP5_9CORY|nr:GNAT family N-acetyltransferase [Corynebacterium doosanense]AIT61643.1 acetyltransferase [Corynebacterium doosanense CAU 212 = DSM 45436]